MKKKFIELEKKDIKNLTELLDRGLAYTDLFEIADYKKMANINNKILKQLQEQNNVKIEK